MNITEQEMKSLSLMINFMKGELNDSRFNEDCVEEYTDTANDLINIYNRQMNEIKLKMEKFIRKQRQHNRRKNLSRKKLYKK